MIADPTLDDLGEGPRPRHRSSRPPRPPKVHRCRSCGCTDHDRSRCVARTGAACWWVAVDLCSACVTPGEGGAP